MLITGASTGIGAALALAYAAQKCRVALHYSSSRAAAENLAKTIRNRGGEVFPVQGDFSIAADVERVVEDSAQHFGRLDGLVNNAASAACLSRTERRRITTRTSTLAPC